MFPNCSHCRSLYWGSRVWTPFTPPPTHPRPRQMFYLQGPADQSWSLESVHSGDFFFHKCSHTVDPTPSAPLGPLTLWTVRVQSPGVTKRVAPAASWEELAVIHAECVSGDWVTLPRVEEAGSTHCIHCWNRRHLTYTRQMRSVCGGACVCAWVCVCGGGICSVACIQLCVCNSFLVFV